MQHTREQHTRERYHEAHRQAHLAFRKALAEQETDEDASAIAQDVFDSVLSLTDSASAYDGEHAAGAFDVLQ